MKSIIIKTFIGLLALSFIGSISIAQTTKKEEAFKEKSNIIEIKTEKEIKDANVLKVSDDKVNTKANIHDCIYSKDCKDKNTTMNNIDCCKDKSTTINKKDCCKNKSTTMNNIDSCKDKRSAINSKDCCKVKSKVKKNKVVKPETK